MTTTLIVDGMSCPSCIRHVTAALALPGVAHVEVQLREGRVVVHHDAPIAQLIRALADAGYVARPDQPML